MTNDIAVLGVGMHPWGTWGHSFVKYGVHAARAALADAGVDWQDVELVVGGETVRNGYAGYVAGATFAQALGWKPTVTGWGYLFDFVTVGSRNLFDGVTGLRTYAAVDSPAYAKYSARMSAA